MVVVSAADASATWLATWVRTVSAIATAASGPSMTIRFAVVHNVASASVMELASANPATRGRGAIAWIATSTATILTTPM